MSALSGCGDDAACYDIDGTVQCVSGDGPAEGLYLGTDVSFRVADGLAYEFRFSHIECRVPHPDNDAVALCLSRPDGQPDGQLVFQDGALSGLVGDVFVEGTVVGTEATGTWMMDAACFDGSTCQADGVWTATWKDEPGGSIPMPPIGNDSPVGDQAEQSTGNASSDAVTDQSTAEPGAPAPDATESQLSAWEAFEAVRIEAGLPMPRQDDALNAASQAHADYFALHADKYQSTGLNPHEENPDWEEGYSGTGIGERLAFHGATGGSGWGEVMAFTGTAAGAVHGWMDTLYHRIPFVHPNTASWGFGIASGATKCEVIDYSMGAPAALGATTWEVTGQLGVPWPAPGATSVDESWNGAESPQPPLPSNESYPSGPIITLSFASGTALSLDSATLTGPDGSVPVQVQTPDNDAWLSTTWSIYAFSPLDALSTYTVDVVGSVDGQPYEASWSFTTR
ncbi:MAG: CAP domain-containing protein [Myxococcota bacterium]